jgi:hypothetical protein
MTEGLRACRERAGFAAASLTRAELAAMPLRPISEALCLAAAAELSAANGVRPKPSGHRGRRPARALWQLTAPVASARGNAAGASHADDASANLASRVVGECRSQDR